MNLLDLASSSATEQITVEFPNLFQGTEITYSRGFDVFGLSIYWYGILIATGILLAYIYATFRCDKVFGLPKGRFFDVVLASVIGGFLGARIYYCVFTSLDPNSGTKYDLVTVFTKIHDGGLAIYGGIIGALLVGFIMCKIRKISFFATCDVAALGFLIGQTIGRWGNFINQEAFGSPCEKDWIFAMKGTIIGNTPVHPCFLYESAWCLLGFVLLHIYSKKLRSFDGELILLYLSWYGLGRFFIESNRSDSLMAGDLKISQVIAAVCFVAGMALYITFKILTKKKNIPLYVNTDASSALIDKEVQEELKYKQKREEKKNKKAPSILGDENEADENDGEETSVSESSAEDPEDDPNNKTTENDSELTDNKEADTVEAEDKDMETADGGISEEISKEAEPKSSEAAVENDIDKPSEEDPKEDKGEKT
ncbi:MAG: prolipoprotein diacylglyceryl transferase [Oscillospiraceae bacterium]|nr:prolipoprotein diacylglyceryl transferase [Oscillospiraceae bacterium]